VAYTADLAGHFLKEAVPDAGIMEKPPGAKSEPAAVKIIIRAVLIALKLKLQIAKNTIR
jgi:hypothetical protein